MVEIKDIEETLKKLKTISTIVDSRIEQLLPVNGQFRLHSAMRYSALSGGKKIRPYLTVAVGRMFGADEPSLISVGAAIEIVHCYSLIHDDLPAMDDDDMRRGKPSCHKEYDEATAILAGDSLLTLAFEILSSPKTCDDPKIRSDLVSLLAQSVGSEGMAGGQMYDLLYENIAVNVPEVMKMQSMKTAGLFVAACVSGAILGGASERQISALRSYAHAIGLAFQIVDDLLDIEGNEDDIGKRLRKDTVAGKATFVKLVGTGLTRSRANLLVEDAISHLSMFDERAAPLKSLAEFILYRKN
jgi:farnesyl diphosphate synthase